MEIDNNCQQFAVDLLEECRTSDEVELLLKQSDDHHESAITNPTKYPRLTLAVIYGQKKVCLIGHHRVVISLRKLLFIDQYKYVCTVWWHMAYQTGVLHMAIYYKLSVRHIIVW